MESRVRLVLYSVTAIGYENVQQLISFDRRILKKFLPGSCR
jgi:hypothetical protein